MFNCLHHRDYKTNRIAILAKDFLENYSSEVSAYGYSTRRSIENPWTKVYDIRRWKFDDRVEIYLSEDSVLNTEGMQDLVVYISLDDWNGV